MEFTLSENQDQIFSREYKLYLPDKEELKKMMVRAIDSLTEKERSVVVLYYYEDMTLKEISLTLEVSESRVSQLHTKALNKMKKILGDYVFSL